MSFDPKTVPVIVGIGEITEKHELGITPREPLTLMRDAARRAEADAGLSLDKLDSLDVVMPMSWRYKDLAGQLAQALETTPQHAKLGPSGGETPLKYIHQAAQRITQGHSEMAVVVGGEAQYSLTHFQKQGQQPPWTPFAMDGPNFADTGDAIHPLAVQHGLYMPVNVYGFFEAASAHKWGQTPQQAQEESANTWAKYAAVAARNPYSWKTDILSAHDIKTVTPKNRMIGGPYPKSMVANMNVNQSAAVLITSLATARANGIDDADCVFITGGAGANEPRNFLKRDQYSTCHAQEAVLKAMWSLGNHKLGALELYSCFPCVPKMARRTLGLSDGDIQTVTGGLSFFGAPLNNYMSHAACAMVRAIRRGQACGTLYGQGEFMTKHYGLRLSGDLEKFTAYSKAQKEADAAREAIPPLTVRYSGPAILETFTMMYERSGQPTHGVIIAKTPEGERSLVTLPAAEKDGLAALMSQDSYPIGRAGFISQPSKGGAIWQFT